MPDKRIPHSEEAEQSVLGGVMLDKTGWSRVGGRLKPGHFFLAQHRILWESMSALNDRGEPIDVVTVSAELDSRNILDRIGGNGCLAELVDNTLGTSNLETYVDKILERAHQRALLRHAGKMVDGIMEGDEAVWAEEAAEVAALSSTRPGRQLRNASDLRLRGVRWLWDSWLPLAKFVLFGAAAGTGKGIFWSYLAACVTGGRAWPDSRHSPGYFREPRRVAVFSPEDLEPGSDEDESLGVRLLLTGADMDMVTILDRPSDAFGLSKDHALIVIDHIQYDYDGDPNNKVEVDKHLQRYRTLARDSGACVLGVQHTGKYAASKYTGNIMDLILGSTAWVANARWVLMLAEDLQDKEHGSRILVRAKGNLGGVATRVGAYRVQGELANVRDLPPEDVAGIEIVDEPGVRMEDTRVKELALIGGDRDEIFLAAIKPPGQAEAEDDDRPNNVRHSMIVDILEREGGAMRKQAIVTELKHRLGADAVFSDSTIDKDFAALVKFGRIDRLKGGVFRAVERGRNDAPRAWSGQGLNGDCRCANMQHSWSPNAKSTPTSAMWN